MAEKYTYAVDMMCDNIDHTVRQHEVAKNIPEAIRLACKYWEGLNPKVTGVYLVKNPTVVYAEQEVQVTLTRDDIHWLTTFIGITTNYRNGERDTWKELAKQMDANGKPVYKNAKGNADFWETMIGKIEAVKNILNHV